ncbi:MAG: PIN domain-containing protein [Candidatus Nanohaloarchaea archaeon]
MKGYLLDTWAWIEYYEGSETGAKVNKLLDSDEECFTSIVTVSELSDNYHRKDIVDNYTWKHTWGNVEANTRILSLRPDIAAEAGEIKSREIKEHSDFSLIDAIILATARKHELRLISGDSHLKSKEICIEPPEKS